MINTVGPFLFLLLKIFGWTLLILLLAAVLLLSAVLFVPVRYQAEADNETDVQAGPVKNLQLHIKASWLMHLIHISVHYGPDGHSSQIRAAGIDFLKVFSRRAEKKAAKENRRARAASHEADTESAETEPAGKAAQESAVDAAVQKVPETEAQKKAPQAEEVLHLDMPGKAPEAEMFEEAPRAEEAPRPRNRRRKKAAKKRKEFSNKKSGMRRQNLQRAYREFTDTANRSAAGHLWREICFLLKHCSPKKLKADIIFSLSDPALTGEVLGAVSMFPFVYRHPCVIVPDFASDTMYVKGMLFVKGKVRFGVFLLSLLRLFRDRNFRSIFRRLTGR